MAGRFSAITAMITAKCHGSRRTAGGMWQGFRHTFFCDDDDCQQAASGAWGLSTRGRGENEDALPRAPRLSHLKVGGAGVAMMEV